MPTWKAHNLKDSDKIWFGKYKGKQLKNIPNSYFKYLLDNDIAFRGIKNYAKRRVSKDMNQMSENKEKGFKVVKDFIKKCKKQ